MSSLYCNCKPECKYMPLSKTAKILLLGSILIIYKQSEDANYKNKNLKAKIYHMVLKTMLEHTYPSFLSVK